MKRPAAPLRARVVAVIGGGKMGSEVAATMAAAGWEAHVVEPDARVRASLPERWREIARSVQAPRDTRSRLHLHEALASPPWARVDLVVEAAPERLALKHSLFRRIEALASPRAILTTNTSSLRVTDIARVLERRGRVAGLHWMPPVHIAPLVEIVRAPDTSSATIRTLNAWLADLGKLAVNLTRDVPGMVVNRLQYAMMREACDLIDRGIVGAEDIDRAVQFGFGFRYVACGPLRQRDLNGLAIHHAAATQIYPTLARNKRPSRVLSELVRAGHIGARVGRGFHRWDRRALSDYLAAYDQRLLAGLAIALSSLRDDPLVTALAKKPPARRKA